jgi:hypothetical protein
VKHPSPRGDGIPLTSVGPTAWSLPTSSPSSRVSLPWYFLRTCIPVFVLGVCRSYMQISRQCPRKDVCLQLIARRTSTRVRCFSNTKVPARAKKRGHHPTAAPKLLLKNPSPCGHGVSLPAALLADRAHQRLGRFQLLGLLQGFLCHGISSGLASPCRSRGFAELHANTWPISITTRLRVYLLANLRDAPSSAAAGRALRAE